MPTKRFLYRLLSLFALGAAPIFAGPPTIGDKAPDFQLSTVEGKAVRLSELTGRNPLVLIVLRGYPGYQCPYCNRQVQDFIEKAPAFARSGFRVVMIYPGPPQDLTRRASEFLVDKTLPANFDLLLDPEYKFTKQYGLRWNAPNETAYPSTFVLDSTGVIFFLKVVKAHGGRTTAQEVLDVLPRPGAIQ